MKIFKSYLIWETFKKFDSVTGHIIVVLSWSYYYRYLCIVNFQLVFFLVLLGNWKMYETKKNTGWMGRIKGKESERDRIWRRFLLWGQERKKEQKNHTRTERLKSWTKIEECRCGRTGEENMEESRWRWISRSGIDLKGFDKNMWYLC